jgi:hypothetical protein
MSYIDVIKFFYKRVIFTHLFAVQIFYISKI